MNFPRHFYSELNKLEKSPWKIGGGVSVTLFPLCGAGGDPNVILIRNVAFKSFIGSMRHHFRILKFTIQNKSERKYSCYDDAYMYLTVKNLN
jgi:hypothetical protein